MLDALARPPVWVGKKKNFLGGVLELREMNQKNFFFDSGYMNFSGRQAGVPR